MPDNIGPKKLPEIKPGPSMRATRPVERIKDYVRSFYEGLKEQPLARISDSLGATNFDNVLNKFQHPTTIDDRVNDATQMAMGSLGGPNLGGEFNAIVKPPNKMIPTELLKKIQNEPVPPVNLPQQKFSSVPQVPSVANEGARLKGGIDWGDLDPNAGRGIQLVDDAVGIQNNASGSTMASIEALNRRKSMLNKGEKYVVRKGGVSRDLIGPEAVDYNPRLGEEYGIEDALGFRLLNRGSR